MASSSEPDPQTDTQVSQPSPPPLPASLLALPPLVYAGTSAWLVVSGVLAVLRYGFDQGPPIWLWTAIMGVILGVIGILVMSWQRAASRRGSRGAQRDL